MFGLRDIIVAAAAAIVAGFVGYYIGEWMGESIGRAKLVAQIAVASAQVELERKGEDATLQGMSDYELCVYGLRSAGVSVEPCEQLRGLHAE